MEPADTPRESLTPPAPQVHASAVRRALEAITRRKVLSIATAAVQRGGVLTGEESRDLQQLTALRTTLASLERPADRRLLVLALYACIATLTVASFFLHIPTTDVSFVGDATVVTFSATNDFRGDAIPTAVAFQDWQLTMDTVTAASLTDTLALALDYIPKGTTYRLGAIGYSSGPLLTAVEVSGPADASVSGQVLRKGSPWNSPQYQKQPVESAWAFYGVPTSKPAAFPLEELRVRNLFFFGAAPHVEGQKIADLALDTVPEALLARTARVLRGRLEFPTLRDHPPQDFAKGDALVLLGAQGRLLDLGIDSQQVHLWFHGTVSDVLTLRDSTVRSLMPTWYDYITAQSVIFLTFTATTTLGTLILAALRWWRPGAR